MPTATPTAAGPGLGLALMLTAQFLVMLDASIVTVAIPAITTDLGFTGGDAQWIISGYNIAFGGALILCGRLGDLYGRRRVFVIGMLAFAATTAACGISHHAGLLIAARVAQGLDAAVVAPNALALITTSTREGPARTAAMSRFGIATVLGFVTGMSLSGILVRYWAWPAVFYAAVPVAVVVAALTPRHIAETARHDHRIDLTGAALVTGAIAALVSAPGQLATHEVMSPRAALPVVGGLLLLGTFIVVERRQPEPLVRLGLFGSPTLCAANVVSLASGLCSGSTYLLATMYLQEVAGFTALTAGLTVAPVGVLNLALGLVLNKAIGRLGLRWATTLATAGSGSFILLAATQITNPARPWPFAVALLPMGMSFMATTVTSTLAATLGIPHHEQGLAAGVRQTSFQIGIAIGVASLLPLAVTIGDHTGNLASGLRTALTILGAVVLTTAVLPAVAIRATPDP